MSRVHPYLFSESEPEPTPIGDAMASLRKVFGVYKEGRIRRLSEGAPVEEHPEIHAVAKVITDSFERFAESSEKAGKFFHKIPVQNRREIFSKGIPELRERIAEAASYETVLSSVARLAERNAVLSTERIAIPVVMEHFKRYFEYEYYAMRGAEAFKVAHARERAGLGLFGRILRDVGRAFGLAHDEIRRDTFPYEMPAWVGETTPPPVDFATLNGQIVAREREEFTRSLTATAAGAGRPRVSRAWEASSAPSALETPEATPTTGKAATPLVPPSISGKGVKR